MNLREKILPILAIYFFIFFATVESQEFSQKAHDILEGLVPKNLLTTFTNIEQKQLDKFSNESCGRQMMLYTNGLRKKEMWALKMLDSSSKLPSGILMGNIIDLGMFDECISVQVTEGNAKILGRHCMYSFKLASQNNSMSFSPTLSICVPSGCNAKDIEQMLNRTIRTADYIKNLGISEVDVRCTSVGPVKLSNGTIATLTIFSIIAFFLVSCTLLDILQRIKPSPHSVLSRNLAEFSMCKSAQKIVNTKIGSDSLTALYGIRFLSMCWIVLGHQYILSLVYPTVNMVDVMEWIQSWKSLYIFLAPFAVDTFLMISGFLVSYLFVKEMSKGRKFNIFAFYFHRYIRLTPTVAALIAFSLFLGPHVGSGALWEKFSNALYADSCQGKWWSFLLYINNFVERDNFCLGHLWYLAVDMQLFLISPLILYPLIKKPKIGMAIWTVLFISQIVSPAAIIAINKYSIMLFEKNMTLEHVVSIFVDLYFVTYTRGASWLIGVLFGYLLTVKRTFSKNTVYIGWIACITSLVFCSLGVRTLLQKDYVYNVVWEAAFGSISRPLWAASIAWIIVACSLGYGGPVNTFLSLPIFIPLSRVSYCVYLVHVVIQGMLGFAARTPHYFSDFDVFNLYLDSLTISIVVAFFVSLCFEAPILTLEKMIFRKQKVKQSESREFLHTDTDTEKEI